MWLSGGHEPPLGLCPYNGGDGGGSLAQFQLVQDGGLSCGIQAHHQDASPSSQSGS